MSLVIEKEGETMTAKIHPTAIVDPSAKLGAGVEIGPYAVLGPNVELGEGAVVGPHCTLEHLRAGKNNRFLAHVSAGTPPQDLVKTGEGFRVVIGDDCVFREFVTLNRGTKQDTVIGSRCFLMAYSHIAHDDRLGDGVIMANAATLAGHVEVGDGVVFGGLAAVHQFCRIGSYAMISGLTGIVQDVLPYTTASGPRAGLVGLNLIGMRRAGIPRDAIAQVKAAYKTLFMERLRLEEALRKLRDSNPCAQVQELIRFCESSKRGLARPRMLEAAAAEEVAA